MIIAWRNMNAWIGGGRLGLTAGICRMKLSRFRCRDRETRGVWKAEREYSERRRKKG